MGRFLIGLFTALALVAMAGTADAQTKRLRGETIIDKANVSTLEIDGSEVTATAAELNTMDGITATLAELNTMDGVTSTAAEINILDGVTANATEINLLDGVTATTAELNYLDVTTEGTQEASKAVTADSSGDITGLRAAASSGLKLGADTYLMQADANVTSAELLALNATPITVVAAPAAGTSLIFHKACIQVDYVSAAYGGIAAAEDLVFRYTDGSGDIASKSCEATGFLDATADTILCCEAEDVVIPVDNAALVVHMLTGEITTGDSPLDIRVWYGEIPTELP